MPKIFDKFSKALRYPKHWFGKSQDIIPADDLARFAKDIGVESAADVPASGGGSRDVEDKEKKRRGHRTKEQTRRKRLGKISANSKRRNRQ